jgi:hypothetical protein
MHNRPNDDDDLSLLQEEATEACSVNISHAFIPLPLGVIGSGNSKNLCNISSSYYKVYI